MGKIKNIVFDLGGVIIDLDRDEPVRRLIEIGVKDADGLIDPYEPKRGFSRSGDRKDRSRGVLSLFTEVYG